MQSERRIYHMKKLIFAVPLLIVAISCTDRFSVTAEVGSDEYDGVKVYMIRRDPVDFTKNVVLDSTVIDNGSYSFSCRLDEGPFVAFFELEPKEDDGHYAVYYDLLPVDCIASKGRVRLEYTADGAIVSGNGVNDDYDLLVLAPQREAHSRAYEYKERTSLSDSIAVFYEQTKPQYIDFVRKYASTRPGATLFFSRPKEFYPDSLYAEIESSIDPVYVEQRKNREERIRQEMEKAVKARSTVVKGHMFNDFVSSTREGEEVRLSDIVKPGRTVLVDFWASWCRPCRDGIPELKELYSKYREDGFDIVSVSLDTRKEDWEKALDQEQMPWPQWSTLEGFKSASAEAYAVHSIPFVILIGPDGKIEIVNLHGEPLKKQLAILME